MARTDSENRFGEKTGGWTFGEASRFDPGRDREAMREHARAVASEAVGGEIDVYEGEYAGREEAFEDGYGAGYEHGYTEGFLAGLDARPGLGDRFEFTPAGITDASGRGALVTLIGAVLAAIGYYGIAGIGSGAIELGSALPTPVYVLAFAILFVLGLVRNIREGITGLLFATVFAVGFTALLAFAIEGALVLAEDPSLALADAAGAAVLGGALVLAFVCYWGALSIIDWDARTTARARAREYARGQARSGRGQ
jgi:hypothetical protein